MAQQINATMSTKIALDLLSASESVKSLTAVVRSSQNAWKAQEAEMKSAGDMAGAAQVKYEGLGKSIEGQQAKIDALKAKQAELKGNTADVAQQYLKYQQQIDGANKQLASMQAQQDRAKQAMDYQKSGLAGLQSEYTAAARANQTYVERLQAEGREQEANKAKLSGYKESIANLSQQLEKQSAELDKIASASGKDSDAWRIQKMRVDETATAIANQNQQEDNLLSTIQKSKEKSTDYSSQLIKLKSSFEITSDAISAHVTRLKAEGNIYEANVAKLKGISEARSSLSEQYKVQVSQLTTLSTAEERDEDAIAKQKIAIEKTKASMADLSNQEKTLKTAIDEHESGLADLQQEYTAAARASQAYVTRLEAEGKQQEANKAKMEGYKSSISNLNEQLSKQSDELDRIAAASGKDSEAWRTQKTRVDETATSLAKAKFSMTDLQTEMDKANPSVFNRVKEAISGTNKQAEKTPGLLHKIVEGGLITNAITSGWQRLSSSITDTVKSGLELNEAGEKLKMTWENMGKSANDIQILSDQMSYLRSETGATGGEINNMQTTVDTMTHGVTDKTLVISAGIASIATASHKGGDGMDSLSKAMTRVVASGNLTTTNLAKLEKQAPTLGAQLAKAAGVSQDSFAKMVADGKIKSDDFMNLVYKVGTTSRSTFDQFGKTSEGALAQLSGSWTSIKAKMAAPLLNVKNSGILDCNNKVTT